MNVAGPCLFSLQVHVAGPYIFSLQVNVASPYSFSLRVNAAGPYLYYFLLHLFWQRSSSFHSFWLPLRSNSPDPCRASRLKLLLPCASTLLPVALNYMCIHCFLVDSCCVSYFSSQPSLATWQPFCSYPLGGLGARGSCTIECWR